MRLLDENGVSQELMSIIENTNDLMFVKNRDFVYIAASENYAVNCVRCNGVEDVIGKTDFELFEDRGIAARYREDDERLFTEDASMVEFEEVYPHRDGTNHHCLTSKFLLHDREGRPAAILGQYHDIGIQAENDIVKRRDIDRYVATALSSSFFAANYVDLISHKFVILRAKDYIRKPLEKCATADEAFDLVCSTIVQTNHQDKMRAFFDLDTLAERINGKNQLDCEYQSTAAAGWCRASFIPTEWDENGNVTHVLFFVCSIDEEKVREIEEGIRNKKGLTAIFEEVPGGIVQFEWNGKELRVLNMSQYYRELYGYSMINDSGRPDFSRIHPDDVEGYRRAFLEDLIHDHELEYIFRVWNRERNQYDWAQINAVAEPQDDGTSLVYALYTDVTAQKNAELSIAKKQASLEAALNVSNQLCCEYDPYLQTLDCFTESNFFNVPTPVYGYPDSLREMDLIHPDDIEKFISTARLADDGLHSAHCDVRAKRDGEYRWYSCHFRPYYDPEKERNVVILTIIDATLRMATIHDYEERIRMLAGNYGDSLSFSNIDLTGDTFELIRAEGVLRHIIESHDTLSTLLTDAVELVVGEADQKKYLEFFNRDSLLKAFERGQTSVTLEHLIRLSPTHIEWVESGFDMMKHPVTGDVVGVCHVKSLNTMHISNMVLEKALECDYVVTAVVYADSGEYYIFNENTDEICTLHQGFWEQLRLYVQHFAENIENVRSDVVLTRDSLLRTLDEENDFSFTFYSNLNGSRSRMQVKAVYLYKEQHMIMFTIRNITDADLLAQYKYDSEHDALTGLYNRKTVFAKSRELLAAHPEEQFVMLHCDIQHFHLYNTFFGEEAGDRLLCKIADALRGLAEDYDYLAYGRIESDVFCIFFPLRREVFEKHVRRCFSDLEEFSPEFPLRPAVGAYWAVDPSMPVEAMFSRATIAAKSHKINLFDLISRYDESLDQNLKDTQQITSEMSRAVADEEFTVYLQPKYSLRNGRLVGSEALVRWLHPERGMISPGVFIPIFEKNGFIAELDRYMWEHVCRILRKWQDAGMPMYPVSANISRVSMYSHATVPFLKSLIEKYDLDPKYLELELTETAYMDDPEDLKRMLGELQDYGFKILMDDFGSGYSSLNTLRELPVDVLKLDMKFLTQSENDSRGTAVLSSVVRMSKLLNLPIVAEGVEQQSQADYLRDIGCEYVQGYLFARPMPVAEYEKLPDIAEKSMPEPEKSNAAERIMTMLADNSSVYNNISKAFPSPFAMIEYSNEGMRVIRANQKFLQQFDLVEDARPASVIMREKMDAHSMKVFIDAILESIEGQKSVTFSITWPGENGEDTLYGCVDYEGTIDYISTLMVEFINISEVRR